MDARCPLCTSIFQTDHTGIQACPKCGQQVNVAAAPVKPPQPAAQPSPEPSAGGAGSGPTFEPLPSPYGMSPPGEAEQGRVPDGPSGVPWENRETLGWAKAYVDTWVLAVTAPERFFAGAGPTRGLGDALLFAWLTAALAAIPSLLLEMTVRGAGASQELVERLLDSPTLDSSSRALLQTLVTASASPWAAVGSHVGTVISFPLWFLVSVAVVHVGALVCGAGKNGFNASARAMGYGWAPLVAGVIPCLPLLYASVLWTVGMAKLQETTVGRATLALVLPGLVLSLCCCGVGLVGAGTLYSSILHP